MKIEARDGIMKLLALGGLQDTHVYQELLALLPSAEAHRQAGATIREAWARASADFPELVAGRQGVTVLLGAYHTTGNLERMFRSIPAQERQDRAHMLGTTLEILLLADQAPKSEC